MKAKRTRRVGVTYLGRTGGITSTELSAPSKTGSLRKCAGPYEKTLIKMPGSQNGRINPSFCGYTILKDAITRH